MENRNTSKKPRVDFSRVDSNIFAVIGAVSRALKNAGMRSEATEMQARATKAKSYDEALAIATGYVEVGYSEPDEDKKFYCEDCGEEMDDYGPLCQSCKEEHFYCSECGEEVDSNGMLCEDCWAVSPQNPDREDDDEEEEGEEEEEREDSPCLPDDPMETER